MAFPHLSRRKGQRPPADLGYHLPQISLRISFTGSTRVSPVVERETEAETRSINATEIRR